MAGSERLIEKLSCVSLRAITKSSSVRTEVYLRFMVILKIGEMQTITAKYSNTKIYDWHIVCLSITGLSSSLLFFISLDSKVRSAHKARLKVEIHVRDARRRLHKLHRASAPKLNELGGEALPLLGQHQQVGGARRNFRLLENNGEQRLLDAADQAKLVGPTPSRKFGQVIGRLGTQAAEKGSRQVGHGEVGRLHHQFRKLLEGAEKEASRVRKLGREYRWSAEDRACNSLSHFFITVENNKVM